jgi:hypothetical protein
MKIIIRTSAAMMQGPQRWNAAQAGALRRLALTLLFRLAPRSAKHFRELGGAATLLRLVERSPIQAHRESGMRVLRNLVATHGTYAGWLGASGAISVAKGCFTDAGAAQELRQEAVTLLHALCRGCPANMDRFEAEGVITLLVDEIGARRGAEPLLPCYFTIEMVSLAWTAVLARSAVMKAFLLAHGALERSSMSSSAWC